jgi:stress-induced morphogen
MPLSPDVLTQMLHDAFPDAEIALKDLAGDNDHYQVRIKSSQFNALSKVAQHKLVYAALGGKMTNELHALSIITEPRRIV